MVVPSPVALPLQSVMSKFHPFARRELFLITSEIVIYTTHMRHTHRSVKKEARQVQSTENCCGTRNWWSEAQFQEGNADLTALVNTSRVRLTNLSIGALGCIPNAPRRKETPVIYIVPSRCCEHINRRVDAFGEARANVWFHHVGGDHPYFTIDVGTGPVDWNFQ